MMVSNNNVSPQRPDIPARFESLNDDTLNTTLQFVGSNSYRAFGGINKRCKEVYLSSGMTKKTFLYGYGPLSVIQDRFRITRRSARDALSKGVVLYNRRDVLDWALQRQNIYSLKGICYVAGEEGRIDLLEEVWNNVNDEGAKRDVFHHVDVHAAGRGKMNVLKWIEMKGLYIVKDRCAMVAARYGHLNILKWLKQERRLELFGRFYDSAIIGGGTFRIAARKGNLNILQWLHSEGCPWPEDDDYRVYADELQPEVQDWLHVNGYSNRLLLRRRYSFDHFRLDIL